MRNGGKLAVIAQDSGKLALNAQNGGELAVIAQDSGKLAVIAENCGRLAVIAQDILTFNIGRRLPAGGDGHVWVGPIL